MGFLSGIAGALAGGGPDLQQQQFSQQQLMDQYGNLTNAIGGIKQFSDLAAQQGGLGKQSDLYSAYGALAAGQGPNPALALLQQQTGQNTAAQAALMAGQRGVAANPALMGRQIAQQGAMNQQSAIGQGAALQAQQQLAAMQAQTGLAGQMAQNQLGGYTAASEAGRGLLGTMTGAQNVTNQINAQLASERARAKQEQIKNAFDAASGGSMAAAEYFGKRGGGGMMGGQAGEPMSTPGVMMASHGGIVPEHEKLESKEHEERESKEYEKQEEMSLLDFLAQHPGIMAKSAVVPGIPLKKGDHEDNDVVPALLSPGEIVIPRSHAADPKKAAAFARAVAARKEHK